MKYLLGLDVGTNSVGWCLTDEKNQIVKRNGKSLWGVRLFDQIDDNQTSPAATRREKRNNRRRLKRRKERITLLRSLFDKPMSEVDPTFFQRLDESFYLPEDRKIAFNYTLFNDRNFKDSDYYKKFPTIYHLRNHLLHSHEKEDIRFIYLAMHHMIKYRGNFLFDIPEFKTMDENEAKSLFYALNEKLTALEINKIPFDESIFLKLKEINNKPHPTLSYLKEEFNKVLNERNEKTLKNIFIPFMVGSDTDISKLEIKNDDLDIKKLKPGSEKIDEQLATLLSLYPEKEDLINGLIICEQIYQFFLLGRLLGNSENQSISEAMVAKYDEHKKDLKVLHDYVKKNLPEKYNEIFRNKEGVENNYSHYVGSYNSNGEKKRFAHTTQENFYAYLKSVLNLNDAQIVNSNPILQDIKEKIDARSYLTRQNSPNNVVFPYQLNLIEMKKILDNQSKFYPFLLEKDQDGLTTIDKIISLLTFHIPYYVGPLVTPQENDERTKYAWVKRTAEKIYPWNFTKVVNLDESAEAFIKRMLNHCTYLPSCYCLPVQSIIFSYYNVLSYLNKLNYNGAILTPKEKAEIIRDVFLKNRKVKKKNLVQYFKTKYQVDESLIHLTSSNGKELEELNCSLATYIDFASIFGEAYVKEHIDLIEKIIQDIVIFEDKKILERRLKTIYNITDEAIIKKIKGLTYSKYSSLSKELLMDIHVENENSEATECILSLMEKTNQNLQEILFNEEYNFQEAIANYNLENSPLQMYQNINEYVDDLYVSPGMKRPIIQAYKIIEELEKIIKHPIDEYYVECTRTNLSKKGNDGRSKSRYERIKDLYNSAKENVEDKLKEMLNEIDPDKLQSDKYYLYFTQLGRDIYTGNPIDLDDLMTKYDIDHIIPQSIIKDDSLENRVLTLKSFNNDCKSDQYPIPRSLLFKDAHKFYKHLYDLNLIGEKKYNNLVRTSELTPEELAGFVNRQLVYTSQSVKGLINAIKHFKTTDNFKPKIIYAKGENVSEFRKKFDLVKSRTANNFHHAHDAYLNVIVGRALNTYFEPWGQSAFTIHLMHEKGLSTNPMNAFFNNKKGTKKPLKDGDIVIWDYNDSIEQVKETIYHQFDIMVTTRTYIGTDIIKKTTIYPKGIGNIPVKAKDSPLADVQKYGGWTGYSFGSYCLVKNENKIMYKAIPTMYQNHVDAYLDQEYGENKYEILISNLKINSVIKSGKIKYCITGKSSESLLIKNLNERIFSETQIKLIHKLEKFKGKALIKKIQITGHETNEEIAKYFAYDGETLIISPAANEKATAITLTNEELINFYDEYVKILNKEIYGFSIIKKIAKSLVEKRNQYINLSIFGKCYILLELLTLLKCNESGTSDLRLLDMSKFCGKLTLSPSLSNCKIIIESITGYYTKVLKVI